jgi:hypothetical protein
VNAVAVAGWARLWPSGAERLLPLVLTGIAFECSLSGHGYGSSFYLQSFSPSKKLRHFVARRLDDSTERLARDSHSFGGGIMVQSFPVGKPDGLKLIKGKHHLLQLRERHGSRLEIGDFW